MMEIPNKPLPRLDIVNPTIVNMMILEQLKTVNNSLVQITILLTELKNGATNRKRK